MKNLKWAQISYFIVKMVKFEEIKDFSLKFEGFSQLDFFWIFWLFSSLITISK